MKTFKINILFLSILLLFEGINAFSQDCDKRLCKKEFYADFDFRSQSSWAKLLPGDTVRSSIVVYSKQDTRIFVCADPKLGDVSFRVFEANRIVTRKLKEVAKKELSTPIYKKDDAGNKIPQKDENGQILKDQKGDIVYEIERMEKTIKDDTIWIVEKKQTENNLYDSRTSELKYFDMPNVDKTKRIVIEVMVPNAKKKIAACVYIEVGHRSVTNRKTFNKKEQN